MNENLSINKNIQSGSRINVFPTGDVFYMERVFLYRHGSMEHTVILVGSILQAFRGLWLVWSVNLLPAR